VTEHRPLVGISAYPRTVDIVTGPTLLHTANRYYVDSVVRAGGAPVVIPVLKPDLAAAIAARLDAIVLTGGGDVDPSCYGEGRAPQTDNVDPERDASEMAIARGALDAGVPLLATCRGAQVLNVALGGTLVQHVPARTGQRHGWAGHFAETVHPVRLDPESRLARSLGVTEVDVNSLHHQAVASLGRGLRAVGWAPDGTIEAIELDGHIDVVAVQWHPELLSDAPLHQGLFRSLVDAARRRQLT